MNGTNQFYVSNRKCVKVHTKNKPNYQPPGNCEWVNVYQNTQKKKEKSPCNTQEQTSELFVGELFIVHWNLLTVFPEETQQQLYTKYPPNTLSLAVVRNRLLMTARCSYF
jgi:ribosomal protein L24E